MDTREWYNYEVDYEGPSDYLTTRIPFRPKSDYLSDIAVEAVEHYLDGGHPPSCMLDENFYVILYNNDGKRLGKFELAGYLKPCFDVVSSED
jgi:hypothetical protein